MGNSEKIAAINPYDELPYHSLPIEWSAPERLALCSMLHGGPRPSLEGYRVLELGCGDGANLLPLACYRPHAAFIGIDSSKQAIGLAEARLAECQLHNLSFRQADFGQAAQQLRDPFDFIIMHGVFSWVSESVRNTLLKLCQSLLAPDGLIYMNYNSKPAWNVRVMVRDYLRAQVANHDSLAQRARRAKEAAASMAASLGGIIHPYARLLEQEYRFVCEGHLSYVAHEFLAPENHAYWRSEFLDLVKAWGLKYVADADFNYPSGRIADGLPERVASSGLAGRSLEDTVDLLSYRQLHSPVLAHQAHCALPLSKDEFSRLFLASSLQPTHVDGVGPWSFYHVSGHEVLVKEPPVRDALLALAPEWPKATQIDRLFSDAGPWVDDLILLYRYGMIDIRASEPESFAVDKRLSSAEQRWGGYHTSPLHRSEG